MLLNKLVTLLLSENITLFVYVLFLDVSIETGKVCSFFLVGLLLVQTKIIIPEHNAVVFNPSMRGVRK